MSSPQSLVGLIRAEILDAELAALTWVLVEAAVPIVAAAPVGRLGAATELVAGIVCSVRADADPVSTGLPLSPVTAVSLVRGRLPGGAIEAASLAEIRERLGSGPLPLTPEQLTYLGCVLVLGPVAGSAPRDAHGPLRVVAAHYVRPLARDAHGHTQRLDPVVLATWDATAGRYEHFAWGVLPEIAARLGRRTGDLEADLHHRRDDLGALAATDLSDPAEIRRLVAGYRAGYGGAHGTTH